MTNANVTSSLKKGEVSRNWYVVDASENTLGRVATVVAERLTGKHKPTFTPSMDNGDYVIVTNCDKIETTGRKSKQKIYYRHSGYIGSIKSKSLEEALLEDSTKVMEHAVRGMLQKNKLLAPRMARLKLFKGEHNMEAQKPEKLGVK